jgi:Ca2+-binding RTX toxin-like protein
MRGQDTLIGGAGADTFQFGGGTFRGMVTSLYYTGTSINDFTQGQDVIQINSLGFDGIQAGAASGSKLGYSYNAGTQTTTITDEFGDLIIYLRNDATGMTLTAADFSFLNNWTGTAANDLKVGNNNGRNGYIGLDGDDTIISSNGSDVYRGGNGNDVLNGNGAGQEHAMYGDAGNDSITGTNFYDLLRGGTGNDTIIANGGNDIISGNNGVDSISGGAGNDIFEFFAIADSTTASADTITDFNAVSADILSFRNLLSGTFSFVGAHTNAFAGGSNSSARFNDTTKVLQIDVNGDSTADMEIILTGVSLANLSAADFTWS